MFSAIIVIVSIILVVLALAAGVYYGGTSFSSASTQATVDQLANEGSQIKAASLLYQTDHAGATPPDLATLVTDDYLTSQPANWSVAQGGTQVAYTPVTGTEVCEEFNAKYGVTGVPSCSSITTTQPVCCQ